MARKSLDDPYADRPMPEPRPITPFPTDPFDANTIPILPVRDEPIRISISPLDSAVLYFHKTITYTRWAWALIRLVLGAISIIQSYKEKS